jgi:hypothetical protein
LEKLVDIRSKTSKLDVNTDRTLFSSVVIARYRAAHIGSPVSTDLPNTKPMTVFKEIHIFVGRSKMD